MRKELFESLLNTSKIDKDFYIKSLVMKLNYADILFIKQFIVCYNHLDVAGFEDELNRLFLDNPNKPKRWKIITEILQTISSRSRSPVA